MREVIPVAVYGWPIATMILFALWPARRALLISSVAGWLLLPAVVLPVEGFLDFDRRITLSVSALLGVLAFDLSRVFQFRPRRMDVPMLAWCAAPMFASLHNGLGFYDGGMSSLDQTLRWGVPYWLGRMYFPTTRELTELAQAIFIGGVLYTPLCLFEVRMAPVLHTLVYGVEVYGGVSYATQLGKWGSRPAVFMANPLELGMYLSAACLCGLALVWAGRPRTLLGFPTSWLTAWMFFVTILSKNLGATVLLVGGVVLLVGMLRYRVLWPVTLVIAFGPAYALLRGSGLWSATQITAVAGAINAERAQSFQFRLDNENILIDRALERPVFGWGGWGRSRVFDSEGKDISITDGMWVIALGTTGLFGLVCVFAALSLPVLAGLKRIQKELYAHPRVLPTLALALIVPLFTVDSLFNNFPDPLFFMGLGGISTLPAVRLPGTARPRGWRRARRASPAHSVR